MRAEIAAERELRDRLRKETVVRSSGPETEPCYRFVAGGSTASSVGARS